MQKMQHLNSKMNQMKTVIFKIVNSKKLLIDIPLDIMRKYPVHNHNLFMEQTFKLNYSYDPAKQTDEQEYITYLTEKFKRDYNATSVNVIQQP